MGKNLVVMITTVLFYKTKSHKIDRILMVKLSDQSGLDLNFEEGVPDYNNSALLGSTVWMQKTRTESD